jgi:protein-S-isoprenylcysteine O-methyltransferase Ste14
MSSEFLQRGGGWVVGQMALLAGVIAGAACWHGQWRSAVSTLCGWLLMLAGVICGIAGVAALGRNLTPLPKPAPAAELVQTGIYRLMRHPLYTAVFCGSLGWALVWRSWPALVSAIMLAPFFDAKAGREEHWLRAQFPDYAAYARRVRKFIPWIY